jgi:dTDP-4-dehydrorhamnose 3,5-epimerase
MPMIIKDTNIAEVKLIEQFRHNDNRGAFVKTFHKTDFANTGINFELKESFYSTSAQHVLRGMHFHHSPEAHAKIVFCTAGSIQDVALDIRIDSPNFGQYVTAILSFENNNALYIPKGFAHGFLTLSETATTFYLVDGEYNQASDDGILYNSFGMKWDSDEVTTNDRDLGFTSLGEYRKKMLEGINERL